MCSSVSEGTATGELSHKSPVESFATVMRVGNTRPMSRTRGPSAIQRVSANSLRSGTRASPSARVKNSEQIDGRWWLVTPEGNAFFSKGVDHVNYAPEPDSAPKAPSDIAAWAKMATGQLHRWNFNTAAAWSARELYTTGIAYTPIIDIAACRQRDVWLKGLVVDYFSPEFREAADPRRPASAPRTPATRGCSATSPTTNCAGAATGASRRACSKPT